MSYQHVSPRVVPAADLTTPQILLKFLRVDLLKPTAIRRFVHTLKRARANIFRSFVSLDHSLEFVSKKEESTLNKQIFDVHCLSELKWFATLTLKRKSHVGHQNDHISLGTKNNIAKPI